MLRERIMSVDLRQKPLGSTCGILRIWPVPVSVFFFPEFGRFVCHLYVIIRHFFLGDSFQSELVGSWEGRPEPRWRVG